MDILNRIITDMKKEEVRYFKLLASRSHASPSRKDLQLFDYVKKTNGDYIEQEILDTLYQNGKKGSFYRLRHRLLQDLNKSLWLQHFEADSFSHGLYLFSLAKLHISEKRYKVALHYLKKAERETRDNEHFETLDLVYGLFISLSHEHPAINPETYISLRKENRQKLEALNAIDDILAVITYRLRVSMNYGVKNTQVLDLLEQTLSEYSRDQKLIESPKFRTKVFEAVSKILLQRKEYPALENYLKTTLQVFSEENIFSKQNHEAKLRLLTFLINSLFMNGKYEESLKYVDVLMGAMNEYEGFLYDKYIFFYFDAQVQNYFVLDVEKAKGLLLRLKENPDLHKATFNQVFIYMNLALLYYQNNEFRKAIRTLTEVYLNDEYRGTDTSLKLKMESFELVIRYDRQEEYDILLNRIQQVRKDYEEVLAIDDHRLDRQFLALLQKMVISRVEVGEKKSLKKLMRAFLELEKQDEQRVNYVVKYGVFVEKELAKLG